MAERIRLGTVTEAAEAIGGDMADVWQAVASGELEATHEDPANQKWTIWRVRP